LFISAIYIPISLAFTILSNWGQGSSTQSKPLPQVVWKKDGRTILSSQRITQDNYGMTLVVKRAGYEDQGTYTCEVSNGVGQAQSYSIQLNVEVRTYIIGTDMTCRAHLNKLHVLLTQFEAEPKLLLGQQLNKWFLIGDEASQEVFQDVDALKQKLEDLKTLVNDNNMVGVETVEKGLSDDRLVQAIRSKQIKFGGKISAAYHIFKHATDPPSDYMKMAVASFWRRMDAFCCVHLEPLGQVKFFMLLLFPSFKLINDLLLDIHNIILFRM
ncbi:unnamed protein product, partial [Leptidea sinapis]